MNQDEFNERLKSNNRAFAGDLRGIDFSNVEDRLRHADLRETDLRGANLICIDLREADLRGADLTCANLTGADLRETKLSEADLSGAILSHADLREAKLRGALLHEADLSGADLREANLTDAILCEADLTGANLCDAKLTNANLTNADLSKAKLTGADLNGANLTDAIQIYAPDWQAAYFNLIADLRENEPEAYTRSRRRIIEKFEAETDTTSGVSIATLQKLWDGQSGFSKPRKIDTNPNN
jgi:hypothetical protein